MYSHPVAENCRDRLLLCFSVEFFVQVRVNFIREFGPCETFEACLGT